MRMRAAAALALLLAAQAAHAVEAKLTEFTATYTVSWNGISLGDATMTLKAAGGDCYAYQSVTNPVGIVRMFYGSPYDLSEFCVVNGKVVPKRFQYIRSRNSGENYTLEFDMARGKVRDQAGAERDIPANAQDRFGMHQAVRLWLLGRLREKEPGAEPYDVAQVDDHRIREYRFAITGRETIEIPAGKFDTILIQRVDDPKKTVKFWIAPNRDYMPVKVEQIRGSTEVRLQLKK